MSDRTLPTQDPGIQTGPDAGRATPDNEPCVWMQARLVAYKLCDRNFDCEHCAFDAAMHGAMPHPCSAFQQTQTQDACYPADRLYARKHTWLKTVEPGRHRVGVDAFAAGLVNPVGAAILPPPGTHLEQDQPGCWLADESGPLPIRMPLTGRLVEGNPTLRKWPQLTATDPYGDGWLLELTTDPNDVPPLHLHDAPTMRKKTEEDWIRLNRKLESAIHSGRDQVGPTMQDGGERLMNLRSILGPMAYRGLMRTFL